MFTHHTLRRDLMHCGVRSRRPFNALYAAGWLALSAAFTALLVAMAGDMDHAETAVGFWIILLVFGPVLTILLFVLGRNHRVVLDRREQVLRTESRWFGVAWRTRAHPLRNIRLGQGQIPFAHEENEMTASGVAVALLSLLLGPLGLILSFVASRRSRRIVRRGAHPTLLLTEVESGARMHLARFNSAREVADVLAMFGEYDHGCVAPLAESGAPV